MTGGSGGQNIRKVGIRIQHLKGGREAAPEITPRSMSPSSPPAPSGPWSPEAMLANLVSNLIANAVTSVIHAIWGSVSGEHQTRTPPSGVAYRSRLVPTLQRGAASAARQFEHSNSRLADSVKIFLSSPEAESVARQLFSTRLMRLQDEDILRKIRDEFRTHFVAFTGLTPSAAQTSDSDRLFDLLATGCEQALELAIQDGSLASHEAMSAARFHVIHTELGAIRTKFDAVFARHDLLQRTQDFEDKYRRQVAERHRWIILPHLHTMHRVAASSLFVPPLLRPEQSDTSLPLQWFWTSVSRAVVIGNPGAGKSTLLEYTGAQVASRYAERLVAHRLLTPVFVNVSEYALACTRDAVTVAQFAEHRATSRYQLSVPKGALEYLFETGRAMVLFDGLDEVTEIARRGEVCASIESFCNLYPSVPTIVTSREVGYQHAPLREDLFATYRIEPFVENQIGDFARKWFLLSPEHERGDAERFANSLVRETKTAAPDLRTNPLMLGLICNLYRSEGYIPEHRAEVYEKCAVLLYEQWDRRRRIPTLAFETRLRPVVAALAYWIYTEPPARGGVTEKELIRRVSLIIAPTKRNETQTREAAEQFVAFCKGRAWVFTDIGADTETPLYQFTHRTFLEYFAAVHLVGTTQTVDELLEVILPHIERGEWELVARMAFQIKARQTFTATDELLSKTVARANTMNTTLSSRLLAFALGTLEALVPTVELIHDIAAQVATSAVSSVILSDDPLNRVAVAAINANEDVRMTIMKALVECLGAALVKSGAVSVAAHFVICSWMQALRGLVSTGMLTRDGAKFLEMLRALVRANEARCEVLWRSDRRTLLAAFVAHACPAGVMMRYHGVSFLLGEYRIPTDLDLDGGGVIPLLMLFADDIADADDPWFIESLQSLGDTATRAKLPFFRPLLLVDPSALTRRLHEQRRYKLPRAESPAVRFGAFVVAAAVAEWWVEHIKVGALFKFEPPFSSIVRARYGGSSGAALEELRGLGLSHADAVFARRWAAAEIDLIEKPRTGGQSSRGRGRGKPKRRNR